MAEDPRVLGKASDALPRYTASDADDTVTVSLSTAPGEWLVNTTDAVVVPMSMTELVEALQKGKLTERSLVWRAGMQEWAPVDHVPQLKLVARLGTTLSGIAPPAGELGRPASIKPPPKPTRATPVPARVAPARLTPVSVATVTLSQPPRKTPLAFAPPPARHQEAEDAGSTTQAREEPEALAVYTRPAATASFDLPPEQPLRSDRISNPPGSPPKASTALETLAPLTSDSDARRAPTPRSSDLSVVAAAHFRAVQRSSKRWILICSLASAAAASLVTYWVARTSAPSAAAVETAAPPLATLGSASASPPAATLEASPQPPPSASASSATVPPSTPSKAAKPHVVRRPKVNAAVARPRATATAEVPADLPSAEPNPYDTKPEGDATKPAPEAPSGEDPTERPKSVEPAEPAEPGPANTGF